MNFWAERDLDLREPSVRLADIGGRPCVAFKSMPDHPTTYIFPAVPDNLGLIFDLATDIYTSPLNGTASPEAREILRKLLEMTTSLETLPSHSGQSNTQSDLVHRVYICNVLDHSE